MTTFTVDEFIQECKQRGLSATYQRIAIYKILQQREDHPTAEDIYKEVLKEHPTVSLATIYKNLETLAGHNLIGKVTHLHDLARYDKNTNHHHHLVCIKCKKIIDVQSKNLEDLKIPSKLKKDFKVTDYKVQFDGICHQCQIKD